jgi:HEAT repeat protein
MTERLGRTESPLTVEELLAALSDPRFAVRFEAVVSIARRGPDERLTSALVDVLGCSEPALSTVAAWALGRIGDERAIPPLRAGLDADYRSVRAHCARALGTIGDPGAKPLLVKRLSSELDRGLRLAYSSALGKLRATEALPSLLRYLRASGIGDEMPRKEYALAVARIVGAEDSFIGLLRETEVDPGTSTSQALAAAGRGLTDSEGSSELLYAIEQCEDALAREDLQQGAESLVRVLRLVPRRELGEPVSSVLRECAERLDEFGEERIEYVVLAINTLREASASQQQSVQDAGSVSA